MRPTKEAPRRRWRQSNEWYTGAAKGRSAMGGTAQEWRRGMFYAAAWSPYVELGWRFRTLEAAKAAIEAWLSSRRVTRKRGAR